MKPVLKLIISVLVFVGFLSSAAALDLNQARSQKLVVELPTGYIKATDPKANTLEKGVNAKRKKAYESIAKKTNTSADVVGARAAKKIKKKIGK